MMPVDFHGQTAVITGASSGIGAAFARAWPPAAPTSCSSRDASTA